MTNGGTRKNNGATLALCGDLHLPPTGLLFFGLRLLLRLKEAGHLCHPVRVDLLERLDTPGGATGRLAQLALVAHLGRLDDRGFSRTRRSYAVGLVRVVSLEADVS